MVEKVFPQKTPPPDALDLLWRMLAFDPVDRPSAQQALLHPYFLDFPQVEPLEGIYRAWLQSEFDFERERLSISDVRHKIYLEALFYHPDVKAQYVGSRMSPLMSQIEMTA